MSILKQTIEPERAYPACSPKVRGPKKAQNQSWFSYKETGVSHSHEPITRKAEQGSPPLTREYSDPIDFLRARLQYRRDCEPGFSLSKECKKLRKCSKALVSMILSKQRPLTHDRVDDLCKLMGLNVKERHAFKHWIETLDLSTTEKGSDDLSPRQPQKPRLGARRLEVSTHLLSDWINVYVKDAFRFESLQRHPNKVLKFLSTLASPARISKSLRFLLKEGYLKTTLDGRVVEDSALMVAGTSSLPSAKIRLFHKQSLRVAREAIDLYSPQQRIANAMVFALDKKEYHDLELLIEDFAEKLRIFAEKNSESAVSDDYILYQLLVNICPIGSNHTKGTKNEIPET